MVGGETREQALDLVRKMESSKHFRQTRIDTEKFETANNVMPVTTAFSSTSMRYMFLPIEIRDSNGGMN